MKIQNELTSLLQVVYPVVSAPMAGVGGGLLAQAVSRAGGLGLIGAGYGDRAWLIEQLSFCAGTNFGVGFITWALAQQPNLLDLALEAKPSAIFLSFGSVAKFSSRIRAAGCVLMTQVQTVAQARDAVAHGTDVIVAQGGEAGGHGGLRGTLALVPAVVDAVSPVPVLAAGGIADGRGMAAAFMLGAQGVLCGTAFYAAEESLAPPQAKRRLIAATGDETVKSPLFDWARGLHWPDGPWGLRTLRNAYTDRWANDQDGLRQVLLSEQQRYAEAHAQGNFDIAAVIAGEAADLVRSERPAAAILQSMVDRCEQLIPDRASTGTPFPFSER